MTSYPVIEPYRILLVGGILVFSVCLGILIERLFASKLHRMARKTAVLWDDILVESMRGFVVLWFLLIGLAVILKLVPLPPEPLKIVQRAIVVLAILSGVLFSTRLSKKAIYVYVDRIVEVPTSIFKNFATVVIYLLGFLIALDYLGFSITPLITALGVGGLAVALALQDTLSNLFSGLNILMTRKIRPGDYIRLESGEEGNVTDITWRNTTIRSLDNNLIIVPNSKLGAIIITNTHLPEKEMALFLPVTVGFDNDLSLVERATIEVAREVFADPGRGVPGFDPYIRFSSFTEMGVQFRVILRVKEFQDQYSLRHEFFKRLHERYRGEGIRFAIPARNVTIEKPGA
jgi:small-conductance mechanosensitive channel